MAMPIFKDRIIERENTFRVINNSDGTITLVPVTGIVYESGTPLNAANLNKINSDVANQVEYKQNMKDTGLKTLNKLIVAAINELNSKKANIVDVFTRDKKININDFDEQTLKTFLEAQGINVNYTLGIDNVGIANTEFILKSNMLYDKVLQENKLVNTNGIVVASNTFNSYVDIQLELDQEYYYMGDGSVDAKYLRTICFYDVNKVMTRCIEFLSNKCSFKLNPNERTVSFSFNKTATSYGVYLFECGKDVLKNISINGNDINELMVSSRETSFIKSANELEGCELILERMVNANSEIVASTLYNSYIFVKLTPKSTYYYFGDRLNNIRLICFYDGNKNKTRVMESVNKFDMGENEHYVSITVASANTVNKISLNQDFIDLLDGVKIDVNDIKGLSDLKTYNQDLNTTNDVNFKSVTISDEIPVGTLNNLPNGLISGDVWADTSTSLEHPILRVKL